MKTTDFQRFIKTSGIAHHGLGYTAWPSQLEYFAKLIRDSALNECAAICDKEAARSLQNFHNDLIGNQPFWNGGEQLARSCSESIRHRITSDCQGQDWTQRDSEYLK